MLKGNSSNEINMTRRRKITKEMKKEIYTAAINGQEYLLLSRQLDVNEKSARNLVKRIKSRGGQIQLENEGGRPIVIDEEMKETIRSIVEINCQFTLSK